jgi:hypothetical protein
LSRVLRGMKNSEKGKGKCRRVRLVTLNLLRKVGKYLKSTRWKSLSKKAVWAVCTLAYWGSFRLGELLTGKSKIFDQYSDLLGGDVSMEGGKAVRVRVKSPKVVGRGEEVVWVGKVADRTLCPVSAVGRLLRELRKRGLRKDDRPAFRLASGRSLTRGRFLRALNSLLRLEGEAGVSGKSFRSGLPTDLLNIAGKREDDTTKFLGRWAGRSYQSYQRLKREVQLKTCDRVQSLVLTNFPVQVQGGARAGTRSESSVPVSQKLEIRTPPALRPRRPAGTKRNQGLARRG